MDDTICICNTLRRATRAVTKLYDDALSPAGINVAQFAQLLTISRLGAPPTIGELAGATRLDRSTLGRNVRVLERMDLVRLELGEDGRTRVISFTAKGRETLETAIPLWESIQEKMTTRLGGVRREALLSLLKDLETMAE